MSDDVDQADDDGPASLWESPKAMVALVAFLAVWAVLAWLLV